MIFYPSLTTKNWCSIGGKLVSIHAIVQLVFEKEKKIDIHFAKLLFFDWVYQECFYFVDLGSWSQPL